MSFAQLAKFLRENDLTMGVDCLAGVWEARLSKHDVLWVKAHDRTMLGAIVNVVNWAITGGETK